MGQTVYKHCANCDVCDSSLEKELLSLKQFSKGGVLYDDEDAFVLSQEETRSETICGRRLQALVDMTSSFRGVCVSTGCRYCGSEICLMRDPARHLSVLISFAGGVMFFADFKTLVF